MYSTINENKMLEKVNPKTLMDFTKNISKEVRLSGTIEEWRAFKFVEEKLISFGFETKLYKRIAYISHPKESLLTIDNQKIDSITHSMALSTPEKGLKGELIFVGTEEDFKDISVKGKIALIDGLATPDIVALAEQNGAIAAVFINGEYTHEMIVSTVWGNPDLEQRSKYPNIPVISIKYQDGQNILKALTNRETVSCFIKTKVDTKWRQIPTLIATYRGQKDPDSFVLFSGHIDSWHYGAMDNGTANATMLEIARIIGKEKPNLYRSLKLAFWSGHSHGRYAGSALYADENWEELHDHCVAHVNIDSVGAMNSVVLSEGNTMAETKDVIADAIQEVTGETFNGSRFGRSGDQSFWGPGIPSLLMGLSEQRPNNTPSMKAFSKLFGTGKGGGFGWWWHTTEDTIDKIDPDLLVRDCQIYLSLILKMCNNPLIPINQVAAIEDIQKHVSNYFKLYSEHQGLQTAKVRVSKAKSLIEEINRKIANKESFTEGQISLINDWIMSTSRVLVRLNYVNDDEFNHDPASKQFPVPLLADVQKLNEASSESEKHVIITTLTRKANKFNFILRKLIEDLETFKNKLELKLKE